MRKKGTQASLWKETLHFDREGRIRGLKSVRETLILIPIKKDQEIQMKGEKPRGKRPSGHYEVERKRKGGVGAGNPKFAKKKGVKTRSPTDEKVGGEKGVRLFLGKQRKK